MYSQTSENENENINKQKIVCAQTGKKRLFRAYFISQPAANFGILISSHNHTTKNDDLAPVLRSIFMVKAAFFSANILRDLCFVFDQEVQAIILMSVVFKLVFSFPKKHIKNA